MSKLSRDFLRSLIVKTINESIDSETQIITLNNSDDSDIETWSDEDFSFTDLNFDDYEETEDNTELRIGPEGTKGSRLKPPSPEYWDWKDYQEKIRTETFSDVIPSEDYQVIPPEIETEEQDYTQLGDEEEEHPSNLDMKDYLEISGLNISPDEHRLSLIKKIKDLKRGLREGKFRGHLRTRKIIELSIYENIYRKTI